LKNVLLLLILCITNLLFAQRNLIVEYGKYFKVTSKITNKEVEGFDNEGSLYVQGDSLTFFLINSNCQMSKAAQLEVKGITTHYMLFLSYNAPFQKISGHSLMV
jgi:hypothetical protein